MVWPQFFFFFFKKKKKKSVEARKKGVSTTAKSLRGAENRRTKLVGRGGDDRRWEWCKAPGCGRGRAGCWGNEEKGIFGFGVFFFGHTAPLVGSLFPDQGLKPHPQH